MSKGKLHRHTHLYLIRVSVGHNHVSSAPIIHLYHSGHIWRTDGNHIVFGVSENFAFPIREPNLFILILGTTTETYPLYREKSHRAAFAPARVQA